MIEKLKIKDEWTISEIENKINEIIDCLNNDNCKCLDKKEIINLPENSRPTPINIYKEIIRDIQEENICKEKKEPELITLPNETKVIPSFHILKQKRKIKIFWKKDFINSDDFETILNNWIEEENIFIIQIFAQKHYTYILYEKEK